MDASPPSSSVAVEHVRLGAGETSLLHVPLLLSTSISSP